MSAPKTGLAPFVPCSKAHPCGICGERDWCTYTADGRVRQCMRVIDAPGARRKTDKRGQDFALYFAGSGPAPTSFPVHEPAPIADVATRHRVYSALLQSLPLWPEHRDALLARGLTDEAIDAREYRSLPSAPRERTVALKGLRDLLGLQASANLPDDVPGFHRGRIVGATGLLIPVRDEAGNVLALKVRADRSDAKYIWFSSAAEGGASPASPAHVPFGAAEMLAAIVESGGERVVRVTEGPLKADVATGLSGVVTVGIPGATAVRALVPALKSLDVQVVRLAWDSDARKRPKDPRRTNHVAGGLEFAAHLLAQELPGARVEIETWAHDSATFEPKGVDDALFAGAAMQVHAGAAMWRELVAILRAAGREPKPETLAKAGMEAEDEAGGPANLADMAPDGDPTSDLDRGDDVAELDGVPRPRSRTFDRGDAVELGHALLEDLRGDSVHPIVYDRGLFWRYDAARGVFVATNRDEAYNAVSRYAGCWTGTSKPRPLALNDNGIKGAVNAAARFAASPGFFDAARKGVCFEDAFLTAIDGEVRYLPHSPDHRCLHALPVRYEMDADRDRWIAMLREVFRRQREDGSLDHEDTEACICLLQEFIGACLMGLSTAMAACLILVGEGNDGKSKVLSVLRALFPASALCALPPQDWGHRFRSAELAGKRLNVVSELPERDILDAERFKAVVAGDPLTAERKNQDPFLMTPEAGHLFAANALPPTKDQSKGFWRRFKVIPCTRQFQAAEEVRDYDRLVIAEELAGVAAWAIDGAARVQAQQRYTSPASSEEAHAEWRHDTDQVRQWRAECCSDDPASEDGIATLYAAYRAWREETGHPQLARNTFGARLKGLGLERRTKLARFYRVALKPRWRAAAQACSERRI